MIKGDKIKLIKPMGVFTNVGEICEVTNVIEDGVITFRFGNGLHLGCMSYDEFLKYFEMVEEKPKREWSDWATVEMPFYNLQNELSSLYIKYRENGKRVQVRADGIDDIKGESTCSKYDDFDIDKGFTLAKRRFLLKYLAKTVKDYAKTL